MIIKEIESAELDVIKLIQKRAFKGSADQYKNLDVVKDDRGILRVKTRLTLLDEDENFRYPILLPNKHSLVEKLILEFHLRNKHVGVLTMITMLREKYWILKGRKTIKSAIKKCLECKRFMAEAADAIQAPLPIDILKANFVFQKTGVDGLGPLYIKGQKKVWVILFCCAVY